MLGSFEGTVLPWALGDARFWLSVIIYTIVRIMIRLGLPRSSLPDVDSQTLGTIGAFLTFFLVFCETKFLIVHHLTGVPFRL